VSDDVTRFVRAHGGTLFVSPRSHRCCHGSLTTLDATTAPPKDAGAFASVSSGGIEVRFRVGVHQPDQLVIELRGIMRPHPVAYWDGCAFRP
jgi:hypothetical protein